MHCAVGELLNLIRKGASTTETTSQTPCVRAGISSRGATNIIIFTGIMTATRYTDILDVGLVRFISEKYPDSHRFQQDNDQKDTSRYAQDNYARKGINWWKTPTNELKENEVKFYLCAPNVAVL